MTQDVTAEYHAAALECSINEPFVLLRFTLGDRAPTITGVKVYGSDHSIPSEINMEVDFAWNGSQNMELFVAACSKKHGPCHRLRGHHLPDHIAEGEQAAVHSEIL